MSPGAGGEHASGDRRNQLLGRLLLLLIVALACGTVLYVSMTGR